MAERGGPGLRAGLVVAGVLAAGAAQALPLAEPPPVRQACVAGSEGWFQAEMAPVFTLESLAGGRYRITTPRGQSGEGRMDVSAWNDQPDPFAGLFDRGAAVALMQDGRTPLMVGVYGEKAGARTWLLRMRSSPQGFVRCGEAPATLRVAEPGRTPSSAQRRLDALPTPQVRLPAGATLGGAFEPGRYQCSLQTGGAGRTSSLLFEFYASGDWRRPNARGETGYYQAVPRTGRFEAYIPQLGNNTHRPDEDYAVYYRSARGTSQLYGRRAVGNTYSETHCERMGPVQGSSPSEDTQREAAEREAAKERARALAAERRQRNLQPPVPGRTRWQGLYAKETFHQKEVLDPGPYGGFSRLVNKVWSTWEFLDFQPNGHVYLGLRPAGTPCDRPAVKDDGHPLCTTYSVDGGRLRIGHDPRGAVRKTAGGLRLGDDDYLAVPPLTPRRLAGTYEASSCSGALCEKTSWVFGADGSFGAYGINQAFGTGAGPAGLPVPRGWTHTRRVEGTYRVDGQVLQVTYEDGQSGMISIFLFPPQDRTLRIGGTEYLRKR